jgi:tetratricopeptide (TPR) repeat protein
MSKYRVSCLFVMAVLASPIKCLAQSEFITKTGVGPKNDFVVSVQDLRMTRKARRAFDKGVALLKKGNTAASSSYFEQVIAENPGFYRAHYNLGLAQLKLGRAEEAQASFQKAIDLTGGGYAPPQFGMGIVLCQLGEFPQAEVALQRGLDLEPGSANGKYFMAVAQLGLNRLLEAERSIRQALLRSANFPQAYFLLARIHQRQNNSYAVVEDLREYLKLDPHSQGSDQARAFLEQTQQMMKERANPALVGALAP